jgi:hypothetical protein
MELRVESREGVLWVTATGRVSLSEALRILKRTCDVAVERKLDRILVDASAVKGTLSTLERHQLGTSIAEYARTKPLVFKVASFGQPPVVDGFSALVASNRGVIAETFRELDKAIDWLSAFAPRARGEARS